MEKQSEEGKQKELDREASQNEQIRETGQAVLDGNSRKHKVELLTVIGEIEGHESAPSHSKTTKYEHVLPKLALIEDDERVSEYPYGFPGAGRGTFHRCTHGGISRLFLYRAKCYHGGPSGAPERNVHRRSAVLPQYGKNPGPDHCLCIRTFTYHGRTDGGADVGYLPACKRCGDYAGG